MKFIAAGDALIQQRIPQNYEGMEDVKKFIGRGDVKFFNLETTLNYVGECFASQFSGGTYMRTNPEIFKDILNYGFNMTSFNNNHTMDFSYEGMFDEEEKSLTLLKNHVVDAQEEDFHSISVIFYIDITYGVFPENFVFIYSLNVQQEM